MNNSKKVAVISGISGMDGSHLSELLLEKGYEVWGIIRRVSHPNTDITDMLVKKGVQLIEGDLGDSGSLYKIISGIKPDEFYNLAAQSHVGTSFDQPEYTADVTGVGVLRILEQIRLHSPKTRFYQASTSECFGDSVEVPQNENTPFCPRSPYAAAKVFAHHIVKVYRESYGLHASCGILFNHESPRRGLLFVTRKITDYVARFKLGITNEPLMLGSLDSKRDWGAAPDYVEGMWLMLQQDTPDDYVLATGETHSVREFVEEAFKVAEIDLIWNDKKGLEECARTIIKLECEEDGKQVTYFPKHRMINIDPLLYRPAEVPLLLGDYAKAKRVLGWEPKMKFSELVKWMVDADIERLSHVHTENKAYNK